MEQIQLVFSITLITFIFFLLIEKYEEKVRKIEEKIRNRKFNIEENIIINKKINDKENLEINQIDLKYFKDNNLF